MNEKSILDSTVRSDGSGVRSREGVEHGVMWVAPHQRFLAFAARPLRIGRGDDCDCVLPGAEVSRYHAEIAPQGGLTVLRDLNSTNGVHHAGRRVPQAFLKDQDVIRLGEWVGIVCSVPRGLEPKVEQVAGLYAGHHLRALLNNAEQVAYSDLPLILRGESGTGKEMLARFIHERSGRTGPFVGVNCAALPESLAEAELFGHSRGAFTGADKARPGYIRAANGGTLLLDEISDLPLAIQAKLLRVLEDSAVTPLGESHPVRVDLRVIAAGQKSLAALVRTGQFRGDLYARLNGLELALPPLRARREEVPYIFGAVLRESSPGYAPLLQPQLVERLCLYDWPFNVRELVQVTRRIAALSGGSPVLRVDCLPPELDTSRQDDITTVAGDRPTPATTHSSTIPSPSPLSPSPQPLRHIQDQYREQELEAIRVALREHDGNVTDTAKALGISRQRLYRIVGSDPGMDLESYRRRR